MNHIDKELLEYKHWRAYKFNIFPKKPSLTIQENGFLKKLQEAPSEEANLTRQENDFLKKNDLTKQENELENFVRSLRRLSEARVQINANTSVEIELPNSNTPSQLPVNDIADWLNPADVETAANKSQLQALKYLGMNIAKIETANILALIDELKKVGKI